MNIHTINLDFLKEGVEVYQDVFVQGMTVQKGVRECAERYALLKPTLALYKRPFTVLDVGANLGYFGLRILHDFPLAVVVMADYDPRLRKVVELTHPDRCIVLEHTFTPEDLYHISECEHFDVTLLLSVLHHWEDWALVLLSCCRMSTEVWAEVPNSEDRGACNNHLLPPLHKDVESQGELMGMTLSHTSQLLRHLYRIQGHEQPCVRKAFINPTHNPLPEALPIYQTMHNKYIKKSGVLHQWVPGINLWTYHVMGGVYPSREHIVDMLKAYPLPKERHGDIRPWNFIIGDGLHLIDGHDANANFEDVESMEETIRIMRQPYED